MNDAMIEFRHVSKTFSRKGNPVLALKDINLSIAKGDIFGIIGYSGAGKSTLLRLINRLESPGQGEVVINGEVLQEFSGKRLRAIKKDIGMIFQNFNLLNSKTVFHNVAIPLILQGRDKAFIQARVTELLEFVNLSDKVHSFPNELSGGQKQRVGIARALATNPSVLLCDEATSALDPQTTDQILELLLDINRRFQLTIVLITHEMHVVRKICDRVAVMENGSVVEEGDVISVFTHPQQPITRQFVRQISQYEEAEFNPELNAGLDGTVIKLTFTGHNTHQPVVGELTLRYGLPFNILHGKMTQTAHGVFGQLWVHVVATEEQVNNILADLRHSDIEGEVIKHA